MWTNNFVSRYSFGFSLHLRNPSDEIPNKRSLASTVCLRNAMDAQRNFEFSAVVRPHSSLLEKAYAQAGKRTKSAAARILLSAVGWNELEAESLN